jgi:hypothetical protein
MSFTTRSAGAFGADFSRRIWASSSFLRRYDEPKSSLNHNLKSVPLALTADTPA